MSKTAQDFKGIGWAVVRYFTDDERAAGADLEEVIAGDMRTFREAFDIAEGFRHTDFFNNVHIMPTVEAFRSDN